jgi:hypothetical protein
MPDLEINVLCDYCGEPAIPLCQVVRGETVICRACVERFTIRAKRSITAAASVPPTPPQPPEDPT